MNHSESNVSYSKLHAWQLWRNPIFLRYCTSRLRLRSLLFSGLIVIVLSGFLVALSGSVGDRMSLSSVDRARSAIVPLMVLQGLILFVLGTAQVSGGMVAERDEGVIDYQRLIPMSPLAKVVGYLFGLPVREYFLFAVSALFSAWALWVGEVSWAAWLPPYVAIFSSALLYHFTGLVTGTVVRNRRWAFLASVGIVFALYTVIPQLSRFGLVFFKYLTINPVLSESYPALLPTPAATLVEIGQALSPTVRFFGLDFSEIVFTLFSQIGLILTFVVMLCRKWRQSESHLLGKLWAAGFFIWVQVLLLGNALPLIEPGDIFPSRGFSKIGFLQEGPRPIASEVVAMSGIYGLFTLFLMIVIATIVTPTADAQVRGWRRARKKGWVAIPWRADAATGFWTVLATAIAGAGGWFIFTRALVESHWFPGKQLGWEVFPIFLAVLFASGVAYQVLLESRGGRAVALATIFIGVIPVMVGVVMGVSKTLSQVAPWVIGFSPFSLPIYGASTSMPISDLPQTLAGPMQLSFRVWVMVFSLVTFWLIFSLHGRRKRLGNKILQESMPSTPPTSE